MRYLLLIVGFLPVYVMAQGYPLPSDNQLGIVQFFRKGSPLSMPIMELYGQTTLQLRFDVFGNNENVLYYSVELCEYDWTATDIDVYEYMEGFLPANFQAFSTSMNTLIDYVHYRLDLPNDDIKLIKPGNYKLHLFRDEAMRDTLLSKRFVVFEELLGLELKWDTYQSQSYGDRQELHAKVIPNEMSMMDLAGNIKLTVLQNNNWKSGKTFNRHTTSGEGNLLFNAPGQIVFYGRNEFRFFDMKSLKFWSERVDYIEYKPPCHHVYLKPDNFKGQKQYFTNGDLNGQFFISNQETRDPDTLDAEYALVHFTLEEGVPLPLDIYIEGALTHWGMSDNYMEFNPEKGRYEKVLLLKQGLYNYRYAAREYNNAYAEYDITEGEFYETANVYTGFVYYRPIGARYYRPVAISTLNTGL